MTRFSAFCRFANGARFSSKMTHGERIFHDMNRNMGGEKNYSSDLDSLTGAETFATAMLMARCLYTVERAGSQFRPLKAVEQLPQLEHEYGVIPERDDTIHDRQRTVAAHAKIPRGARYENVVAVLTELLGEDFIAYRPTPSAEVVEYPPSDPASVGVYKRNGTQRSVFFTLLPISLLNIPVVMPYVPHVGAKTRLFAGDQVIVDPGDLGRVEAVTITAATTTTFTATFTKPHDDNAPVATGRHPHLITSKRENLFVLSATALRSGRSRAKANRAIRRLLRAISIWHLTEETTPGSGTVGPFKVNEGQIGYTALGAVTL